MKNTSFGIGKYKLLAGIFLVSVGVLSVFLHTPLAHADVGLPAWWGGSVCDADNYPGSYQLSLGAEYDGVIACGPGNTLHLIHYATGLWGEYEWQCVELSARYLYSVFGQVPYNAPGGEDFVANYPGTVLTKVNNDGTSLPSSGDVFSVGSTTSFPLGHTAIITAVNVTNGNGTVSTLEQNGAANGIDSINVINNVLQSSVTGWLHDPQATSNTPNFKPAVIQRPSGETDIAAVGPGNTLAFYYNAAGSTSFGGGVISGSSAYSTPVIVQRPSGETDIVVEGPSNSLLFYYNAAGSNSWGKLVVPSAVAYSTPAVIQRASGETDIAVQDANNKLAFYYNAAGSTSFGGGSISGTHAYSGPAMIQRPSGETDIATQGAGSDMSMYFNAQGSNSWGISGVAAPGWALSAPSIVQRSTGETDIAVQGPSNSLDFYINTQGSNAWGVITAAGNSTTYNTSNPPSMLLRPSGETDIALHGSGDQADLYYNAQGSSTWGSTVAAVSGYSFRVPAMVQRSTGETDLIIIGPNNRLDFYYNAQGSSSWGSVPIAGNNSAS